jgi:hypothetical protein
MRTACASVLFFSLLAADASTASASSSISEQIWFVNNTSSTLSRTDAGLDHGEWSYTPHGNDQCAWSQEPPRSIAPRQCVTWGSQSAGVLTGTQGHVSYAFPDGDTMNISWDNPYVSLWSDNGGQGPSTSAGITAWGNSGPSVDHIYARTAHSSDGNDHTYDTYEVRGTSHSTDALTGWKRSVGSVGGSTFGPTLAAADEGGTAWAIGRNTNSEGNAFIYSSVVGAYNTVSSWNEMPGGAAAVAVSPEGTAWVLTGGGAIYRWNGSGFDLLPGCATSIGVGSNNQAWVTGCGAYQSGGHAIFKWTGSAWQQMPGAAGQIAVSPEGTPWVVTFQNSIFKWDGQAFQPLPGCANSIGVGANNAAYVLGCGTDYVINQGYGVYQWNGADWNQVPGAHGYKVTVSPHGTPWIVDALGTIHEFMH